MGVKNKDSAKLFLFYNKIKLYFEKEPYFDSVKIPNLATVQLDLE